MALSRLLGRLIGRGAPHPQPGYSPLEGAAWSPLEIINDAVFLNVTLGGRDRTAVLDTGATVAAVDATLAAELGLSVAGQRTLRGSADVGSHLELDDLMIAVGAETVRLSRAAAVDLDELSSSYGRDVHLILGTDLFRGRVVDLDLPARRWRVVPEGDPSKGVGEPLRLQFGAHGEPMVLVSVEGWAPQKAVLDLGASAALSISQEFASSSSLLEGRATSTAAFAGVNGVSVSTSLTVAQIAIAGSCLRAVPAEVFQTWVSNDIPLNVGFPILRRFRIVLDYAHLMLWMRAEAEEVARPFRKDRSGLGLALIGREFVVKHVSRGSPAEAEGWSAGDVISAVDGRSVGPRGGQPDDDDWRAAPPGRTVSLALHDGEVRSLTLADYY